MPPNLPGHPDVVMGGGPSLQASLATWDRSSSKGRFKSSSRSIRSGPAIRFGNAGAS